jgi:hypothetical protein
MGSDDFPKHESFSLQTESLLNKFIGTENIVALNGHVWKKHRMVGELTTEKLSMNPTLTFSAIRLQTPHFIGQCPSSYLEGCVKR